MEDYKIRGKNVDAEYTRMMAEAKKKGIKKPVYVAPVVQNPEPKPPVVIPSDIVGKKVKHRSFGIGIIVAIQGVLIDVQFDKAGLKKMGYELCMQKNLLEFI